MIAVKNIDSTMVANNLEPYIAIHPGEVIKDEIETRRISQRKLATQMGVSITVLNEILNGKRALNTEFALLIEAALGLEPEMLVNMQTRYNMQITKKDALFRAKLESIRKICASVM